jgi:hypothetical protein
MADSQISSEWLTRVSDAQTKERPDCKLRLLICDSFSTVSDAPYGCRRVIPLDTKRQGSDFC